VEPAMFTGTERHHQFTATLQALSLSHSHVLPQAWLQLSGHN
jgi:hypothetical protein